MDGVLLGHCLDSLATLEAGSVHCCVTSPPYFGLRDYGLPPSIWGGEAGCGHEWGEELPEPTLGRNDADRKLGSGNPGRQSSAAGAFCLHCGAWRGCLGLEPTPALYVEHLTAVFEAVRRVLADTGTLWLNLGDSYAAGSSNPSPKHVCDNVGITRKPQDGLKPKDLIGVPWRAAFALQAAGWYLRSEIIWAKPNPMPESCRDRPTKAHEQVFLLSKAPRYWYDADAIAEPLSESTIERFGDNPARSDYRPYFEKRDGAAEKAERIGANGLPPAGQRNARSVWTIATQPYPGAHFAVFPAELAKRCILAGCPEGGVVLDPFGGSGTVAEVARREGRRWLLCEQNPEYAELIAKRLEQQTLF